MTKLSDAVSKVTDGEIIAAALNKYEMTFTDDDLLEMLTGREPYPIYYTPGDLEDAGDELSQRVLDLAKTYKGKPGLADNPETTEYYVYFVSYIFKSKPGREAGVIYSDEISLNQGFGNCQAVLTGEIKELEDVRKVENWVKNRLNKEDWEITELYIMNYQLLRVQGEPK